MKKNKIIPIFTILVMCITFVFSGFTSHAVIGQGDEGLDFYVPYSRPVGDGVGYLSVVVEQNGIYKLETFVWNIQPFSEHDEYGSSFDDVTCWFAINNNQLAIMIDNNSENVTFSCNLVTFYYSDSTGTRMDLLKSQILSSNNADGDWVGYDLNYNNYNMNVVGFEYGGNAYLNSYSLNTGGKFYTPIIHWNEQVGLDIYYQILRQLNEIVSDTGSLSLSLLQQIKQTTALEDIHALLSSELESIEQEKNDKFEQDSGQQSEELDSLNQQTQVDKVDVDSVSEQVDSVLEMETDANYGVVLSAFTGNGRILTMMLLCVSVALISFVLFGKR